MHSFWRITHRQKLPPSSIYIKDEHILTTNTFKLVKPYELIVFVSKDPIPPVSPQRSFRPQSSRFNKSTWRKFHLKIYVWHFNFSVSHNRKEVVKSSFWQPKKVSYSTLRQWKAHSTNVESILVCGELDLNSKYRSTASINQDEWILRCLRHKKTFLFYFIFGRN